MGADRIRTQTSASERSRPGVVAPHATPQRYRLGCRCDPCRRAFAFDRNARENLSRFDPAVDAMRAALSVSVPDLRREAITLYLRDLQARGIGLTQLSRLTGVSRRRLTQLRSQRLHRVTARTAHRIYAASTVLAKGASVPARTMRRRLRSLKTMGYRRRDLSAKFGTSIFRRRRRARVKKVVAVERFYRHVTALSSS